MSSFGVISLIPAAFVIAIAILSRKPFESLILGGAIGYFIYAGFSGMMGSMVEGVYAVLSGETFQFCLLVNFMFGAMIELIERSGGAVGFADSLASKVAKTQRSSMLTTWVLGIIIFIDDFLNALAVGSSMRKVTDKYKVPREFLAYIVNSTGATACVLIPVSSWAAFFASQMTQNGVGEKGMEMQTYYGTIPFLLYAWIAIIVVPLFIMKIIPVFGPMKQAWQRTETRGQTLPDSALQLYGTESEDDSQTQKKNKAYNFLIPMITCVIITLITGDLVLAEIVCLILCFLLYIPQKVISINTFCISLLKGFQNMVYVMMIIFAALLLQEVNNKLGLTEYVIETVAPILSPELFPVVIFIVLGLLTFATGSIWGVAAIAFPIIIPLAAIIDVNLVLASAVIVSGSVFGSHACFFCDAATLTSASTQITNTDYARNVLPLVAVPFILTSLAYLLLGFLV